MKSRINVLLEIVEAVLKDAASTCFAEVSVRDLKTIRSRVRHQGISFVTITLPNFCSDFERCLELELVDPALFQSFRKSGAIPAFLRGMLGRVFNQETGRINDEFRNLNPALFGLTVSSIRQVCCAFKKIELACAPQRERRALAGFIENEQSFSLFSLPKEDAEYFSRVSSVLWDGVWNDFNIHDITPRHGPGATVEGISGNSKYRWQFWYDRLEPYFPLCDTAYPAAAGETVDQSEELKSVTIVRGTEERPVRVTLVPKTLKGPRIIAIEPCCMQYTQQAIRDYLYRRLESHERYQGHINFSDQSINQDLALMASAGGHSATIDLSDASDRVPRDLALEMFRSNPDLRGAVEACRSTSAVLPDGSLISLRKFASMGSALCFPIEAMYFYTACVIALLRERNLPVSHWAVNSVAQDVYVYGDDIIVPSDEANAVLECLAKYNCKVNSRKSFVSGRFRESCGTDGYFGERVTPTYLRRFPPENRQQASEVLSTISTANQLSKKGYWRTSAVLFNHVEAVLGKLPPVGERTPVLGHTSGWRAYKAPQRWNARYQRLEVRCWVPSPVFSTDVLEGYGALQKCLLRLHAAPDKSVAYRTDHNYERYIRSLVELDEKHLERSALYGRVTLKRQWVPASEIAGVR